MLGFVLTGTDNTMKTSQRYRKLRVKNGRPTLSAGPKPIPPPPRNGNRFNTHDTSTANGYETVAYQNHDFTACRQVVKLCLDKKGKILSANRDAEELYGLRAKKLKGLPISMFIHPDDVDDVMMRLCRPHHSENEKILFLKNRHISNHGQVYYISWVVTLHYDKYGELNLIDKTATGILPMGWIGETEY